MRRNTPRYKKGDLIGGRFQVHQALMGGMGEVYLGYDEKHGPIALKTFQAHLSSPHARKLFNDEVYKWVQLEKHPNIVRCHFLETIANQPFMLLEWVAGVEGKGTDLRSWLRYRPLELRQALDFTIDICRGLIHAQEKQPGIVHRDLKPGNILINQSRQAKITDFGLATISQQANFALNEPDLSSADAAHATQRAGKAVGTPPYMPPEQWQGNALDARADIYAIGCILYEMLTGKWPFTVNIIPRSKQQKQQWLSAWQVAHEEDVPTALPASFPTGLQELLQSCLAKEPANRFSTVSDLLQQLSHVYTEYFSQSPQCLSDVGVFNFKDYLNRGFTYDQLGRYKEALSDYQQAIHLNQHYAQTYNNRGFIYDKLGRYKEAFSDYTRAIDLNPNHAQAYLNRACVYHKLGHYKKGLSDLNQAIYINSDYADAYYSRGLTYRKLGRYEEALSDYGRAIELNPHDPEAYYNRGFIYDKQERYKEALSDFNQAIDLNPYDAEAYSIRGNTYQALQCYEEALADYRQAIALNPNYADVYFNAGILFYNGRMRKEALPYFDKAAKLGHSQAPQIVERIRRELGIARQSNPLQAAFEAFVEASSAAQMQTAVAQHPLMVGEEFIAAVVQVIEEQVPVEQRAVPRERLAWLRGIARE